MEERLRFVARLLDGEGMSEVCREFGISRKTGYKIFNRYQGPGARCAGRPLAAAGTLCQPIARTGGTADCRSQARQAALGRQEDQGTAGTAAQWGCAAPGQEHRACGARPPRSGQARPRAQEPPPGHAAVGRDRAQRPLVCRLQRRVQARQWPLLLPPDGHRPGLTLPAPVRSPRVDQGSPGDRGLPESCSANAACRSPSGATTGSPSPVQTASTISPASRSGGCGSASPSSASSRAARSRTDAMSACT